VNRNALPDMHDMPDMIVVYGSLRSGTTMLRLMLDGHPQLNCPGESDFVFDHLEIEAGGKISLDLGALRRERIFQAALGDIEDQGTPEATLAHMLRQLAAKGPKGSTLVLMLHRGISKLRQLFADMPVIHMLRDPRDVARSGISLGWAGNVYYGANHWIETEGEWDRTFGQARDVPGVFDLKHETLVEAPERTLRALCDFAGLEWTPAMLSYDGRSTYDKPDTGLLAQWKRKLTPRQVGLIEAKIGAMLTARGYAAQARINAKHIKYLK